MQDAVEPSSASIRSLLLRLGASGTGSEPNSSRIVFSLRKSLTQERFALARERPYK